MMIAFIIMLIAVYLLGLAYVSYLNRRLSDLKSDYDVFRVGDEQFKSAINEKFNNIKMPPYDNKNVDWLYGYIKPTVLVSTSMLSECVAILSKRIESIAQASGLAWKDEEKTVKPAGYIKKRGR